MTSPRRSKGTLANFLDRTEDAPDVAQPAGPVLTVAPVLQPVRRPTARRRHAPPAAEPWARVLAARDSAIGSPKGWTVKTLKLPPDLLATLKARRATDMELPGTRRLEVCHYLEAALAPVGESPIAAAALAAIWQRQYGIGQTETEGSGRRMSRATADRLSRLGRRLDDLPNRVWLWEVTAGAVLQFLAELEGDQEEGGNDGGRGGRGPG
jgi:hypothetical protein